MSATVPEALSCPLLSKEMTSGQRTVRGRPASFLDVSMIPGGPPKEKAAPGCVWGKAQRKQVHARVTVTSGAPGDACRQSLCPTHTGQGQLLRRQKPEDTLSASSVPSTQRGSSVGLGQPGGQVWSPLPDTVEKGLKNAGG